MEANPDITRLRSALENYGRHFDWCAYGKHNDSATLPPPCDCGLARELSHGTAPQSA